MKPTKDELLNEIPANWRDELQSQLHPGENVQAALEVDLDSRLCFGQGLVVVTDRRLIARNVGQTTWQAWDYHHGLELLHHDHAGVGHLDLVDSQAKLAGWCFTLGQNLHAIRVFEQFHLQSASQASGQLPLQPEGQFCPICR